MCYFLLFLEKENRGEGENKMSSTVCVYPQVGAFVTAENVFLGPKREWIPEGEKQAAFVKILEECRGEIPDIPELESMASRNHEDINHFLALKNFDIRLKPFPPPDSEAKPWGAASVLDVVVEWLVEGGKRGILNDAGDREFEGVALQDGVQIFMARGRSEPIVGITTKSGDVVYMTMRGPLYFEGLDLLNCVETWSRTKQENYSYKGVRFPMIDLDEQPDISWLVGLRTYDQEKFLNEVTQALQQTRFKMNEKGARVKSAVAIGGMRSTSVGPPPRPPYVINEPFVLWIERPGLRKPLFVADLTEENFKNPNSLEM